MDKTELRKMSRLELIEIIYALQQEEKVLEEEKKKLEDTIASWTVQCAQAGSIAEAALSINGVFEAAQAAADQYLDYFRRQNSKTEAEIAAMLSSARQEQEHILAQAQEQADSIRQEADQYRTCVQTECRELIAQTDQTIKEKWSAFDKRVQTFLQCHDELSVFLDKSSLGRHPL